MHRNESLLVKKAEWDNEFSGVAHTYWQKYFAKDFQHVWRSSLVSLLAYIKQRPSPKIRINSNIYLFTAQLKMYRGSRIMSNFSI